MTWAADATCPSIGEQAWMSARWIKIVDERLFLDTSRDFPRYKSGAVTGAVSLATAIGPRSS